MNLVEALSTIEFADELLLRAKGKKLSFLKREIKRARKLVDAQEGPVKLAL